MNFDAEDDNILHYITSSGVANLLSILPKLRQQSAWVKPWLTHVNKVFITVLYENIFV